MKKILIVDDQLEVRELVEISLRDKDFHVLQAENAKEAIEIAKEEKPDLVIMDILMPGEIDGLEATRMIKSDPLTKDIKIIMLTVKGLMTDMEEGLKAGADGYVIKPFRPFDLIRKMEEVIG